MKRERGKREEGGKEGEKTLTLFNCGYYQYSVNSYVID